VPGASPDDLYGLPLERFIPERAALAKTLRGQKRREDAAAVAAMRKPSVAAWAVNQLVRTQDKTIHALFDAGDDLARAQAGAATGKRTAEVMRDAAQRQRGALDELLEAAKGLLSSDGHPLSATTVERVTDTLRAASIDEASRRQVTDGRLTQELRFAGLGIGDLTAAPPQSPPAHTTKAKQETEEHKAALKAARQSEAKARRAATRAQRELADAQERRQDAVQALEEAERRLAAAKDRVETTAAELGDAERAMSDLEAAPPGERAGV
jgi:hypothetical protein